jgi:hypothetical protein
MPNVKIDPDKNRLYLKFRKMDDEAMSEEVYEVAKAVRKLKSGFTCLTEIAEDLQMNEKESRYIRLIIEFISLMGVSKVIRIGSKANHEKVNKFSNECGDYEAELASSVEVAEKILDKLIP